MTNRARSPDSPVVALIQARRDDWADRFEAALRDAAPRSVVACMPSLDAARAPLARGGPSCVVVDTLALDGGLAELTLLRDAGFDAPVVVRSRLPVDLATTRAAGLAIWCVPRESAPGAAVELALEATRKVAWIDRLAGEVGDWFVRAYGVSPEVRDLVVAMASGHPCHALGAYLCLSRGGVGSRMLLLRRALRVTTTEAARRANHAQLVAAMIADKVGDERPKRTSGVHFRF
jgi:hypothetical protein